MLFCRTGPLPFKSCSIGGIVAKLTFADWHSHGDTYPAFDLFTHLSLTSCQLLLPLLLSQHPPFKALTDFPQTINSTKSLDITEIKPFIYIVQQLHIAI